MPNFKVKARADFFSVRFIMIRNEAKQSDDIVNARSINSFLRELKELDLSFAIIGK